MSKSLTKFCVGCNLNISTDDFYDHPSTADRLGTCCKLCARKCTAASQERARVARAQAEAEKGLPMGLPIETYIDRHEQSRARESEIAAKLRTEETETEVRRSSFAELVSFEGQKTFSPRWRVA